MFSLRRAGSLIAATTTTAVVLAGVPIAGAAEAGRVEIRVANITDFHGRLEANIQEDKATGKPDPKKSEMGAANIAGIVDYIRADNPNTLFTTSGDNQGGSAFVSAIKDDEYTMKFIQEIGTHGSAVGNHEFDKGYKDLIDRVIPNTKVDGVETQLGANIFKEDGSREVKPYRIVEVDGVKVALVGTTSNLTVAKSNPANVKGLNITDSAKQVNEEAKTLKDSGEADVVIALIHDPAKEASEKLDSKYVDFVFGGDTHVRTLDTSANVPYAQSHEYGKVVTGLDFTFDKTTGKIVELDAKQYDATDLEELNITPNAEVAALVDAAKAEADVLGKEVVATVSADFKRGSNPGEGPGSNRGTESTANNMIAQSAVVALSAFLGEELDFGIMNAGGVREDLATGDVTYAQAFKVQPFGNDISVATVSGATLKEMLENQWQTAEQAEQSGRPRLDMGLSDNVAYTYNPDAERGNRITSITIDGKPVDPTKEYRFAASSFLLDGGDKFIDPAKVKNRNDVGYNDLEAFTDYLKTGEAKVRAGQKDVGVVLPKDGLKAGKNEIKLTSLSYSSEGEPKAENVTVKIGDAEATAKVNNDVTEADKGYGEQGRATVTIDIPAGVTGEQTLQITTDAGTDISMPVTVGEGKGAPAGGSSNEGSSNDGSSVEGSSTGQASATDIVLAITATFAVLGLIGLLASSGIKHIAADIIAQMPNVPLPKLPF